MVKLDHGGSSQISSLLRKRGNIVPGAHKCVVLAVLLAAPIFYAQTAPAPPASASDDDHPVHVHKPHKAPIPAPPPVVLPPMPSGPLSQMPMDQIPPSPAKVTFQGGLLSISAQNSTLGEILRDVRKLTGAAIEIPSGTNGANEHVVTHLGPGTPRDVLVSLLNGSSFNYVMLGTNSDPTAVASVILTPKEVLVGGAPQTATNVAANAYQTTAGSPTPPGRFPGSRGFNPQGATGPRNTPAAESDDAKDDDQETAEDNTDDQTQPAQQVQPDATAAAEQQVQPTDANQPNAGPKTPEQILEMLRRPQQQQPGAVVTPSQPPQQ